MINNVITLTFCRDVLISSFTYPTESGCHNGQTLLFLHLYNLSGFTDHSRTVSIYDAALSDVFHRNEYFTPIYNISYAIAKDSLVQNLAMED